jgi:hypothetical protein
MPERWQSNGPGPDARVSVNPTGKPPFRIVEMDNLDSAWANCLVKLAQGLPYLPDGGQWITSGENMTGVQTNL